MVIILFVITLAFRFYFFKYYYVFSNDDIYYFDWVDKLTKFGFFHNSDLPIMPPGYPFILVVEKFLLKTSYNAKLFEYVFIFSLLPLFIIRLLKVLNIRCKLSFLPILFLIPFTLVGTNTINISSEIWFSIIITSGLIASVKYQKFGNLYG